MNQIMKLWNYFFDGNQTFKFQKNCNNISKSSIRFIIKSERFNRSITYQKSNTHIKFSSFSCEYTY